MKLMNTKPLIKINKLNVTFNLGKSNEAQVLKNISLEIYPGEFVIFFGPSGCGKSTLLYSIAGLETNTQGDIFIDDKNLTELSDKEIEKIHQTKIGMIFQAYYLINSLTVLKNIILPQIAIGGDRVKRVEKAAQLMEHFGVKEQADKLPAELSGGQQQRVAICRSLINDPDILLADEPVGNLDSKSTDDVMNLLKDFNAKQRKTIILVTHNPAHLNYAHRVFYMKDGIIIDTKINEPINEKILSFNEAKKAEEKGSSGKGSSGPALSKDLELLARTYSSIGSNIIGNLLIPFKAKQITAEALTGLTTEEINKIEKKTEELLIKGINDNNLTFKFFDENIEQGGLGLNKTTAQNLSIKIKSIIEEIKIMESEEEKLKARQIGENDEINQVRRYLLDSSDVELRSQEALDAIDSAVKDRLENKIDRVGFQALLDLPLKKNGAGLDKRSAKKLAKRLELLMLGKQK